MRILFLGFGLAWLAAAQSAPLETYLRRVFAAKEFDVKTFGPAAWLEEGAAYTTVEKGEIIRYETAGGKRTVLVSAAALTPSGAEAPLKVEGYKWSKDQIGRASCRERVCLAV